MFLLDWIMVRTVWVVKPSGTDLWAGLACVQKESSLTLCINRMSTAPVRGTAVLIGHQSGQVYPSVTSRLVVGQYIAMCAMLTAKNFFLVNFYPSGPFTCIFSKTSHEFLLLAAANTDSCVGPHNKIGHPAGCTFRCRVPAEYKQAKKKKKNHLWYHDL